MNIINPIRVPLFVGSLMLSSQAIAMQHDHEDMGHEQHAPMSMSIAEVKKEVKLVGESHTAVESKTQHREMQDDESNQMLSSDIQYDLHSHHDMPATSDHAQHLMQSAEQNKALKPIENPPTSKHSNHVKEHGGQIFQSTKIETKWINSDQGQGASKTEWESRIGTDEHKVFLQAHLNKAESQRTEIDAKILYSRNVSDYWDVQAGVRYRDHHKILDQAQFDAVFGVQGLAPYFFETEIYAFVGADDQYSLSLETERDVLLTQKLILKPYINADLILSDQSKYAQKSGLSMFELGLETRYEINKKIMPYLDLSYAYDKGLKVTRWQSQTGSGKNWNYGAGIRFRF